MQLCSSYSIIQNYADEKHNLTKLSYFQSELLSFRSMFMHINNVVPIF